MSKFCGTSTCVLMPPPNFWDPIVEIKRNHMNPKIKRPPYPHITMMAPFVEYEQMPEASSMLRMELSKIEPFIMRIEKFEIFYNNSSYTIYLRPDTPSNPDVVNIIQKAVLSCFPNCPQKSFEPHIGIGFFKSKTEAEKYRDYYQSMWKPMEFLVKEIYFNTRTSDVDPWEVRKVVSLGAVPNTPNYFKEIPEPTKKMAQPEPEHVLSKEFTIPADLLHDNIIKSALDYIKNPSPLEKTLLITDIRYQFTKIH